MRGLGLAVVLFATSPAFAGSVDPPIPGGCASPPSPEAVHRFAALPRLHAGWAARNCYPPRLTDADLARSGEVDGVLIPVNGHVTLVRNPEPQWTRRCDSGGRVVARPLRTTGRSLLQLRRRIEASVALRSRDLLEVGLGRARVADGSLLYAVYLATRERAIRLQCYTDFDAAIEQAGAIFRRDEHAIAQLYDFLHVERGLEPLSPPPPPGTPPELVPPPTLVPPP